MATDADGVSESGSNKKLRVAAVADDVSSDYDASSDDAGDDYYDSGEEYYFNNDDDSNGEEETNGVTNINDTYNHNKKPYVILTEDDVRRRQAEVTSKVAEILSFPAGFTAAILRHFKWDAGRVEERWFTDDHHIRAAVGLRSATGVPTAVSVAESTCAICFAVFPAGETRSAACGAHFYCADCWRGFIATAVSDGARCLTMKCPDMACSAAVVRELVDVVAGDDDKDRYAWFALRSFVEEGGGGIKWCPAPGCALAVELVGGAGDVSDVFCGCRHGFCWRCGEEAHRPVTCDTVRAWLEKNASYSETANWVLANTKLCPKCRRPIEKDQGCMHMTCSPPCGHEFCWVCLDPWSDHRGCKGFQQEEEHSADDDGSRVVAGQRRRHAEMSLDRYFYHYERWVANFTSLEKVRQDMDELERSELGRIAAMVGVEEKSLGFLTKAYEQIADGRRVLKWAYAYGYYLDPVRDAAKRGLFEYLLDQASSMLDQLHGAAELERREIFVSNAEPAIVLDLMKYYQTKVESHTKATQGFMANLVEAFETTDLPEFKSLN